MNPNSNAMTTDGQLERDLVSEAHNYSYSDIFYRYIEEGSLRSARVVLPLLLRELSPESVLDVGCGAGAWLSEYRNLGITDYLGVDGAYVQPSSLLISSDHFQGEDVSKPFELGRRFDIVQCLEVGEHLPANCAETLVANLVAHGDKILFSAATPGQGGENHINEQTHEYWRQLFAKRGFKPFDPFRPAIMANRDVESWYRRNMILFVAESAIASLSANVRRSVIPDDQPIPALTSWIYRIQSCVISLLPLWCVSKVAHLKHNIVIARRYFLH